MAWAANQLATIQSRLSGPVHGGQCKHVEDQDIVSKEAHAVDQLCFAGRCGDHIKSVRQDSMTNFVLDQSRFISTVGLRRHSRPK